MMPETPTDGWSVEPVVEPPIITMDAIHAYKGKAGTIIPNIKLNVSWKGDRPTKKDTVIIGVQGVMNFFFPTCPVKHSIQQCHLSPLCHDQLTLLTEGTKKLKS